MSWWPRGLRRKSHTLVDQSFSGSNPGRAKISFYDSNFFNSSRVKWRKEDTEEEDGEED